MSSAVTSFGRKQTSNTNIRAAMTDASSWNSKDDLLPQVSDGSAVRSSSLLKKDQMWRSFAKSPMGKDGRHIKFFVVLASTLVIICGISGWIGWATTSVRPITHTKLCLVSTDYHDNDLLPSALFSDRAVGRLASLCSDNSNNRQFMIELVGPPAEFVGEQAFGEIFPTSSEHPFLLYVAAHGVSSPAGPILLPKDAKTYADGVLVKDLIKRFGEYSPDIPKALILDACGIATDHRWGILHNDFSYQVQALNEQVSQIENLTVILDCNVDQKGWLNPASGTTVFGEALILGLRGNTIDNDHDGWLDLWDLHLSTEQHVSKWVSEHTSFAQNPVLLPLGDEGERRAKRNILRPITAEPLSEPQSLVSASRPEMVDYWWKAYDGFSQRTPHPALTTPLLWDRFVATVLRFEHFEMNGSRSAADWLDQQLRQMEYLLNNGRPIDSSAARAALISPLAAGAIPPHNDLENSATIAEHLITSSPADRPDIWHSAIASLDNAYSTAHLRRQVVKLIVTQTAENLRSEQKIDRVLFKDAASAISATQDPLQPTSTLATVFQLLARDLPSDFQSQQDAQQLARLLELWSRCDQVTSAKSAESLPLETFVLPWVEPILQQADSQRRLAFDLMMGDDESRTRAENYLEQSEANYRQIDDVARIVIAAETRLRVGWNRLAWIGASIESRAQLNGALSETSDLIENVQQAYSAGEKLADMLANPIAVDQQNKDAICNQLSSLDAQFQATLSTISDSVSILHEQDLQSTDLCKLMTSISLPGGDGPKRRAAWQQLTASAAQDITKPLPQRDPDVQGLARLLGKLSLAPWTENDFNRLVQDKSHSYRQIDHQLDIFAVDPSWRDVLTDVGYQIAIRYQQARATLTIIENSGKDATVNDSLARRFDGLLPEEASSVIDRRRQDSLVYYLISNTRRGIADCLSSVDQQAMPQFARLSALMVDDISRYASGAEVKQLHQQVLAANSLKLQTSSAIDWTTEQTKMVQVDLLRQQDPNPGFVTITATTKSPLELLHPRKDERVCRPIRMSERVSDPVLPAMLDSTLLQIKLDVQSPGYDQLQATDIEVQGYFRGRKLDANVNINFHKQATQHLVQFPSNSLPRVAIRAPLQNNRAGYEGAIAIVLDCSGSMGAAQGKEFDDTTKYAQAVKAVEKIIHEIPAGVRLSVWTFGQAGSPNKTVSPAEQTIRRVLPPTIWDPDAKTNIEDLVNKLTYPASEPWNESPMVASLIAASRDFVNEEDNFRTVVVITDGYDNRIEADGVNNPGGVSADNVIRSAFSGKGIALNVIGFRVDQPDVKKTADSLSVVTELIPPGRYVQVDKAEDLISAIRACLTSTVQYELHSIASGSDQPATSPVVLSESPPQGAIHWSDAALDPGTYEVRSIAGNNQTPQIITTIELNRGDQLLLERTLDNKLSISTNDVYPGSQSQYRSTGIFDVDLVPVVAKQFDASSRRLFVQRKDLRPLGVRPPGDLWLSVESDTSRLPVRWYREADVPGCSYHMDLLSAQGSVEGHTINVVLTNSPAVPVGRLVRDRDFKHFADLAPATWQDSAGVVRLVDAKIEISQTPDKTGANTPQSCFVLRLECPEGAAFRVRPVGLTAQGSEELYFASANAYTYRAWPLTEADVERSLQALELISVNQVVDAANRSGSLLKFPTLANPSERRVTDGIRPPTPRI